MVIPSGRLTELFVCWCRWSVVVMEFFPSSGHMIGSKRSRPANASKKGSSGAASGGQRPRSGKWKSKSGRSSCGADDSSDGLRGGVSELDIFYFRKIAGNLQVRCVSVCLSLLGYIYNSGINIFLCI